MKKLLFIVAAASFVMSCKKSSPASEGCVVNANTIIGKYVITSVVYQASSTATPVDVFSEVNDCTKDDSYELKADGTVTINEEANDCGLPPIPGAVSSWSLDKNNTVLILDNAFDIKSFDCHKLVVTEKNIMTDGDSRTRTYEKQ